VEYASFPSFQSSEVNKVSKSEVFEKLIPAADF